MGGGGGGVQGEKCPVDSRLSGVGSNWRLTLIHHPISFHLKMGSTKTLKTPNLSFTKSRADVSFFVYT